MTDLILWKINSVLSVQGDVVELILLAQEFIDVALCGEVVFQGSRCQDFFHGCIVVMDELFEGIPVFIVTEELIFNGIGGDKGVVNLKFLVTGKQS